jgi:hypothetical protein
MRAGWFNARCKSWAGSRTAQCQQCYQQARSYENQCVAQTYIDSRSDFEADRLVSIFLVAGKWLGAALLLIILLYVFLSD